MTIQYMSMTPDEPCRVASPIACLVQSCNVHKLTPSTFTEVFKFTGITISKLEAPPPASRVRCGQRGGVPCGGRDGRVGYNTCARKGLKP